MALLIQLLVSTVAILVASYILSGGVQVDGFWTALVIAIVLGVINMFIKPVITILTLPITIVTLGLFMFVLNALLIMLVSVIVPGFHIANFWWAFGFSLIVSVISSFMNALIKTP